ncbi:MAG TPA: CBS domain-containing protein [Steroidobacteraceae bacterium]|nr:CBS domain-containing protein [Steroidobacteraceae bacterium]
MNVGQICQRRVVMVRKTEDLATAARLMREHHIGYLVVVEPSLEEAGFTPIGVLTDRDIVVSVVAREADPRMLRVEDVMTRNPVTIMAEDSVTDALEQMRRIGVRRLPVVGDCGLLQGIVSLDDILAHMARDFGNAADAITRERTVETALRP